MASTNKTIERRIISIASDSAVALLDHLILAQQQRSRTRQAGHHSGQSSLPLLLETRGGFSAGCPSATTGAARRPTLIEQRNSRRLIIGGRIIAPASPRRCRFRSVGELGGCAAWAGARASVSAALPTAQSRRGHAGDARRECAGARGRAPRARVRARDALSSAGRRLLP